MNPLSLPSVPVVASTGVLADGGSTSSARPVCVWEEHRRALSAFLPSDFVVEFVLGSLAFYRVFVFAIFHLKIHC